jgi:Beta-propeller repeat/RTX calcium-binding nonapeptide repeat (4 copies)
MAEQANSFQQLYTPGSDIAVGFETGQLNWGRTGNDFMLGFQKVNPGFNPTQVDYLLGDVAVDDGQGRQWKDTFALGDWQKSYYANPGLALYGLNEYAVITDFNPLLDRVQLFGNANNYRVLNVGTGTLLLLQKPTGLDVVAYFLGTQSLNLNAAYMQYKGNTASARTLPNIKQNSFSTAGFDLAFTTTTDRLGNVYQAGGTNGSIVGGASNNESRDAAVVKYDPQGNVLWSRQFGSNRFDTIYGMETDAQGNVYLTGLTFGSLYAQKAGDVGDVFLTKLNSSGQEVWTRQFGAPAPVRLNSSFSLDVDSTNGSVYLSGVTVRNVGLDPLPRDDFWVTRYDLDGNRQWFTEFGTADYDEPYATAVSVDGSIYAAGWSFANFGGLNQGAYDGAIAKLDPQGNVVWRRQLGSTDYDWIWGADTDSQGNLYVSGYTLGSLPGNTNAGSYDAFLAKYDKDGNPVWIKQFGTAGDDHAFKLTIDSSDRIFITGYTDSNLGGTNAGAYDAWIARYDTNGDRQWVRQLGASEIDHGYDVTTDGNNNVYVTGITQGSLGSTNAGSFDGWIAKLTAGTGDLVSFGSAVPATSSQSTFAVGNTGGNPNVTDPFASIILRFIFGSFLTQQNLPAGTGGATGANVTSLFRSTPLVPGIPAGSLPTGLGSLKTITSLINTATSRSAAVQSRNSSTTLDDSDNMVRGFDRSNDIINGRGGNDFLSGLSGDDILRGGDGDDLLQGNTGRNRLVGGRGADIFVLAKNSTARIVDFDQTEGDRLFLSKGLSFSQLTIQQGTGDRAKHTLIQSGEQLLAIVVGTSADQLTQSSFQV